MTLIITGTCNCPDIEHQISDKDFDEFKIAACYKCGSAIFWRYD